MSDLSQEQLADLADVGFHWGDAYVFGCDGTNYTAHRRGYPDQVIIAGSPEELRDMIRKDYFAWCATLKERMSV